MQPAIRVEGLWQVFGARHQAILETARKQCTTIADIAQQVEQAGHLAAVRNVGFTVAPGELFVVMGLSGSGKSTLIRSICRLLEPTSGHIAIDGEDVRALSARGMMALRRRKIGMVFQHFGLFPHMQVIDNIAFPLRVGGMKRQQRHEQARPLIELVGLAGREHAYPRELSGGQRQRVGIARSLAGQCSIWLLDEPFSALDPLIRRQLQDEFLGIRAKLSTTIVFITHDMAEALRLADRIAIMRDGEIVQIGTPAEIILRPADDYVRAFSRDVARGHHATVASVMRPFKEPIIGDNAGSDRTSLSANTPLDAALASFAMRAAPALITDDSGTPIGTLHPEDLTATLRPETAGGA